MKLEPKPAQDAEFFSVPLARWVIGALSMLIAVVGEESLLGLLLRQTRREIRSIVQDEEQPLPSQRDDWYKYN
jgi:hypothetical protein